MLGKTNKMRFDNIVHLTREHHFNITLVPLHTEHYILTSTRIVTTIYLMQQSEINLATSES